MRNFIKEFTEFVNKKYGDNAPYILAHMASEWALRDPKNMERNMQFWGVVWDQCSTEAEHIHNTILTPATAKVGDGATIHLWSDAHACTIIKVTKTTVTVRRDKATLDPSFKPEIEIGGFCGHCTNQHDQKWSFEPDEKGTVETFHWSKKACRFGKYNDPWLSKGRHEFFDYNF